MELQENNLKRYFMHLCFDGKPFYGWQKQPKNAPTVQAALEKPLGILLRQHVKITGAGRTDTGVHASSYYAHFDAVMDNERLSLSTLTYKLNKMLPPQIAIFSIFPVDPQAHARFSALSRTYQYRISTRKNPFKLGFAWHFEVLPDIEIMQKAADMLLKTEDFSCFSKSNTQANTNICHVQYANWKKEGNMIIFEIRANRFLRNMVRAIVGTLMDIGSGKINLDDFASILESRDRNKAGYSVPGHGLFLTEIEYPPGLVK